MKSGLSAQNQVTCKKIVEETANKQGVSPGVTTTQNLGPDNAEHPLKPFYKKQNRAERFNKLDNRNCFGNQRTV